MAEWRKRAGFGIYVHWPFCAAKCPYCDFNSHVSRTIDADDWLVKYEAAIAHYAQEMGHRTVNTIYFGGGTPSLMPVHVVDGILRAIQRGFPLANDLEITLEANPTSIESDKFAGFAMAGVNRVSVGFQALNDRDLQRLGRNHNTEESLRAWDVACKHFGRTSFDLIYARQDQSLADWESELSRALTMQNGHMSLYQLTVEPNTGFARRFEKNQLPGLPDEDLGADMYDLTQEMTRAAGIPAYEISNHGAPGLESNHNQIYWQGGDYLGIGPGAHGRLSHDGQRYGTETPLNPTMWLRLVEKNQSGENKRDKLSVSDMLNEYLMMSLRTKQGAAKEALTQMGFTSWSKIDELQDIGVMATSAEHICATDAGLPILNEILRQILA